MDAVAKVDVEVDAASKEGLTIGSGRYPSQVRRDLMHLVHAGFSSSHFMWRFLLVSALLLTSRWSMRRNLN